MGIRPSISPIYKTNESGQKVFAGYKDCGPTYSQTKTGKKPKLSVDTAKEEKHIAFKDNKMKSGLARLAKSKIKK